MMKDSEKRQHPRLNLHCLLKYSLPEEDSLDKGIVASVKNISANGILFRHKKPLNISQPLEINLNLVPLNKEVNTRVIVTRIEKIKGARHHLIGATFVNMEREDKEKIKEFIDKCLKQ